MIENITNFKLFSEKINHISEIEDFLDKNFPNYLSYDFKINPDSGLPYICVVIMSGVLKQIDLEFK